MYRGGVGKIGSDVPRPVLPASLQGVGVNEQVSLWEARGGEEGQQQGEGQEEDDEERKFTGLEHGMEHLSGCSGLLMLLE